MHYPLVPAAAAAEERATTMPIKLTPEMADALRTALADRMPCVLATASPEGHPDIGYKGSMMVFDDEHLAYWERTRGQHLANVERNPYVAVLYNNGPARLGWRFFGQATVHKGDQVWGQVMDRCIPAELERDPERLGYAVLIRVDRVLSRGQVLMAREEAGVTPA
jgi:hypothetical protein